MSILPPFSNSSSISSKLLKPFQAHQLQLVPTSSLSSAASLVLKQCQSTCVYFSLPWFSLCGPLERHSSLYNKVSFSVWIHYHWVCSSGWDYMIRLIPDSFQGRYHYYYYYYYHCVMVIEDGVMVIVVGNGHGKTSSNPRRDWLNFT